MDKKIKKVYGLLEDEQSRDIWMNKLSYNLTGDIKYLKNIVNRWIPSEKLVKVDALSKLLERANGKKIIVYGVGGYTRGMFHYWNHVDTLYGFCDKNEKLQKKGFYGWPVISPSELINNNNYYFVVISLKDQDIRDEIRGFLTENGFSDNDIMDMPACLGEYNRGQYFDEDFLVYDKHEVFVDAGCYNLVTSKELYKIHGGVTAYAFEMDPVNYRKCEKIKQMEKLDWVKIFPYGLYSSRRKLLFTPGELGSSAIDSSGNEYAEVAALDEIISEKITFIKMDIEGSELEALKGAKNTIIRNKPKLAICIYHKMSDMYEIPLYIYSLRPDYKFYVRHYTTYACETVLYAV